MSEQDKPKDEFLFTEAHTEPVPRAECSFSPCTQDPIGFCRKCGQAFCLTHSSDQDPQHFCQVCLSPREYDSESKPLVGEDGVQHQGRRILATGDAFHFASKMIHEMDDNELIQHIDHCRTAIELLGKQLDYQRINLTTAEFEAYERKLGKLQRVGGELRMSVSNVARERAAKGLPRETIKRKLRAKTAQNAQALTDQLFAALKNLPPEKLKELLGKKQ